MKLLIITTERDLAYNRIEEEAKKKGIEVSKVLYKNIKPSDLQGNFDFCIERYAHWPKEKSLPYLQRLLEIFGNNSMLDYQMYEKHPYLYDDKLLQHEFFGDIMPKILKEVETYPVIIKKKTSSRCKDVFLLNSKDEVEKFLKDKNENDYFFEEYIEAKKDIRVIVLGNEVVGCVERRIKIKDKKGYKGIGVKVADKCMIDEKVKEDAIKIAKKLECDFCGVDFILDRNGKHYLIEVNLQPQFISSERTLGINIARKLIDFILAKSGKSN